MSKNRVNLWRWPPRCGMTLIEITAAAAMLAVLLASSVQVMRALATQQLSAARRMMALQTVQSLTEELANAPWDELTPDAADKLTVPDVVNLYLPSAALSADVVEEQQPAAKRLSVELRWQAPNGQPSAPLRLTTWVYPEDVLAPE
jgi:type II secretory pathway pseudopilin PulG